MWKEGHLAGWYLRPSQQEVCVHLGEHKNPFLEASRRWGKTTTILCYVIEQLLEHPGWVCRWCEPNKNQAREIVRPEMDKILRTCPDEMAAKWQTTDSVYMFPNGSRLYLRGVNEDKGQSARGSFAHIVVCDELGTWREPKVIINDVLRPQLLTTNGQLLMASTPSPDLGHDYYDFKQQAIGSGEFIQKTIYDNEALTQAQIDQAAEEVGGKDSPTFRREYLCEAIANTEKLVFPEFDESIHVEERARPEFFDTYVAVDLGFNDFTAMVFGYYDFKENKVIVEDELWVNGKNSQEITNLAKEKEASLWPGHVVYKRSGDNDLQQLYDMRTMFNYDIKPTLKDDKLAQVNAVRVRLKETSISIHPRCHNLIFQCKVGQWKANGKDFERGNKTGHLDLLDALVYFNRNIDLGRNPYPSDRMYQRQDVFFDPNTVKDESRELRQAFKPRRL